MSDKNKKRLQLHNNKTHIILLITSINLILCVIILGTAALITVNRSNKNASEDFIVSSILNFDEEIILQVSALTPIPKTSSAPTPSPLPITTISPEHTSTPAPTTIPTIVTPAPTMAPLPTPVTTMAPLPTPAPTKLPTPTPKPKKKIPRLLSNPKSKKDDEGILLQFKDLLAENHHVKGWIKEGNTMDYVVLQSPSSDPEYYLFKDFFGDYYKAGSLFLDYRSSVEEPTQNLVIHGHNMISTPEKMFHYIKFYKDLSFYKKHPIISFDTLYQEADYKVFAIIKTTPKINKDYFFEYRQSTFDNSSDFLNFVYQVRIRSLIIVDDVDINENDTLLTLSTCSYEVNNDYRTVVFARKIREGESSDIDMKTVRVNKKPLYCDDYYKQNGGKAPKVPATFEKALEKGAINWYTPSK